MKKTCIFVVALGLLILLSQVVYSDNSETYVRLVIPKAQISAYIRTLKWLGESKWEEFNKEAEEVVSWEFYPQVVGLHRAKLGLDAITPGDIFYLYKDIDRLTEPVQLQVTKIEIIDQDEFTQVFDRAIREKFALITCHPPNYQGELPPQYMVIWGKTDRNRVAFIEWGDTLWDIARRYARSVKAIVDRNKIKDPSLIRAGEWLSIP